MALKRFPFDLVRVKGHSWISNDKLISKRTSDNKLLELEDEASCSSCSGPRLLSFVDRESGYDAKGKRIMDLKRRSGIRRRRRGNYDCGKFSPVFRSENLQFELTIASCLPYDGGIISDKTIDRINHTSGNEVSVLHVKDVQTGHDMDEKTCYSYEFSGSIVDSLGQDKHSSSLENCMSNAQDKVKIVGNEEDCIKMLEEAFEEDKAAYVTFYLELEKERAAAATAADEAMAMISHQQEEKASMEMETRQYQRMIEERVAYDEEDMSILQEILIRREKDNHFLIKELEAYRHMGFRGSDQSNGKPKVLLDELEQRLSVSLEAHEDPLQAESTISNVKKDEIANVASNYMAAKTCINTEDRKGLEKNREHKDQAQVNLHSSFLDTELDILDVHVIDDNIELKEEETENMSSSSFNIASNEVRHSYLEFGSLAVQSSNVVCNLC